MSHHGRLLTWLEISCGPPARIDKDFFSLKKLRSTSTYTQETWLVNSILPCIILLKQIARAYFNIDSTLPAEDLERVCESV